MTDEYFQQGKSLAELHDLTENDPWQQPVDEEKLAAEKEMEVLQKRVLDQLKKAGFFDKPKFDPTENEDPTILKESILERFWRLTVRDRCVDDVFAIEPSIEKISLSFRNTKLGCWIAFTGKGIARRMETSLNEHDIVTQLTVCDINGKSVNE